MLVNRHKIIRTEETDRYLDSAGRTVLHFANVYDHGLWRHYVKRGDGPPIFQGDTWEGKCQQSPSS